MSIEQRLKLIPEYCYYLASVRVSNILNMDLMMYAVSCGFFIDLGYVFPKSFDEFIKRYV